MADYMDRVNEAFSRISYGCDCLDCIKMREQMDKTETSLVKTNPNKYKFEIEDFITPTDKAKKENKYPVDIILCVFKIHEPRTPSSLFGEKGKTYDGEGYYLGINDPSATIVRFNTEEFRKVTREEFNERCEKVEKMKKIFADSQYKTGDVIEILEDIEILDENSYGCGYITLRKGTSAIIDIAPNNSDDEDDEDMDLTDRKESEKLIVRDIYVGKYHLSTLVYPRIKIFFPEVEQFHTVTPDQIKRKSLSFKDTKLVVPDGYMERIITATKRVTDKDVHDYVYKNLSLENVCQKGRGAIVLLYGPPGTGKTLTAEILAEKINRPLIKLTLGSLTDGQGLAKKLSTGFKRAAKYKGILLLDEVDVFIRRRGSANVVFDENTSVFLRVLEYFDGILIMTTNLINQIDPAVFSRVHVVLEYGQQTEAERLAIWKGMFPPELRKVLSGDDLSHEVMFNNLAKLELNGREIKTVIQNAVCRAVVSAETSRKKGIDAIPKDIKWISTRYFMEEAEELLNQRNQLKGSDPHIM